MSPKGDAMSQTVYQLPPAIPFVDLILALQACAMEWDQRTQADRRDPERNESRLQALKVVNGARNYLLVNDAPERVEDLRAMQALLHHLADLYAQATQRAEDVCAGCVAPSGANALPCFRVSGTVLVRAADTTPEETPFATIVAANSPERAAWLALVQFSAEHALADVPEWYDGPTMERIAI
jgi:hypothetical protein